MTRLRALATAVALVLAALLVTAGCTTLPESGMVHRTAADQPDRPQDAPYFSPPGPVQDAKPAAIVAGFLVAMRANPLSTSVARSFLSQHARGAWKPNRATIVYQASIVQPTTTGARVRLADPLRLDARGGLRRTRPGQSETLHLRLVSEQGQWRIDNPVNALVVPSSFFDASFARFDLFFYDQTGRVLLPDPVFLPRGDQTATNLVRGLLAGPGPAIASVSRSALPVRTNLDLSVVVTESGVAEVPLSRELLQATPEELSRAVDQLARTLRQVPGILRVRMTVAGAPVPLPDGRIDVPVSAGDPYDAAGPASLRLWGLRSGRVSDLSSSATAPTMPGPLGLPGYSLRSLAVSESPRRVAGVSSDGSTLFEAGAVSNTRERAAFRAVTGTDLLRPGYDLFGDLWVVDRRPTGSRVLVVRGTDVREVRIPGVTGQDVTAFAIARDGSRLAVAYAAGGPRLVRVVDILRTDDGTVSGAGDSTAVSPAAEDAGRVVDLGWRDPGTLALLSRPTPETSQVSYVSSDGSPVSPDLTTPSVFREAAQAMVVAPNSELALRLITPDHRLYTMEGTSWPRTASKVVAATYGP